MQRAWPAARFEEVYPACRNQEGTMSSGHSPYEYVRTTTPSCPWSPQVDEMSLTDLMMKALDQYMASRRESEDFKAKVQKALEDADAHMARTRAILLGAVAEAGATDEGGGSAASRGR